jgi:hypothetical protein
MEEKEEKIKYVLKFFIQMHQCSGSRKFDLLKSLINNTTDKEYSMNKLSYYLTSRKWYNSDLLNIKTLLMKDLKLSNLLYNSRKSMIVL